MNRAKTCASGRKSSVAAPLLARRPGELLDRVLDEVDEVAVGQLTPLGPARRAGGVDDRRERGPVEPARRASRSASSTSAPAARSSSRAEPSNWSTRPRGGGRARGPAPPSRGADRSRRRPSRAPESDRIHATCVRGGGLVDRHDDAARSPDREVDEGPLVACAGHQADPVAGLETRSDESLGDGGDVLPELRPRHVRPRPAGHLPREGDLVRRLRGIADDEVAEAAFRRDRGEGCDDVVLHACSCGGRGGAYAVILAPPAAAVTAPADPLPSGRAGPEHPAWARR